LDTAQATYGALALSEDILKRRREAVNNYRRFLEFTSSQDVKEIAFVRQRIQELERELIGGY
jgi:hypothetical protein